MSNLSESAQKECLYIARKTLHAFVRRQELSSSHTPRCEEIKENRGAFITLKRHGQLRGCIGYIEAVKPLWKTIEDCTISAASRDPRFEPVRPDEIPDILVEISVLTPLQDVQNIDSIEVGQHGLLISKGMYRGLLLPQVATEYNWNREQFLEHTCLKAGLPKHAWKEGAKIKMFSADVFSESDLGMSPSSPKP